MDIENIINLVHGHSCLWNQSDPSYHLREHQRKSWRAMSEEMEIPVDELKKKWRGLRDTFGRELKKVTKKQSGQATDTEPYSQWPYFKVLMFLRDTMSRRDVKGNIPATNYNEESPSSALLPCDQVLPQSNKHIKKKTFRSALKNKVNRQKPDDIDAKLLQIEEEQLKHFKENANDSDTQFLMSLRPFLKAIPTNRKLTVRTKLQQVLIDEQNATSSAVKYDYSSDSSQYSVHSMPQNISTQGESK